MKVTEQMEDRRASFPERLKARANDETRGWGYSMSARDAYLRAWGDYQAKLKVLGSYGTAAQYEWLSRLISALEDSI
jgi:hypothetical protein